MTRDTRTQRQKNRAVRQESLREQLQAQGHLQYVTDLIAKLEDAAVDLDSIMVQRYRAALDARFKLIAKFIPDLRSVEHTGEIQHAHRAEDFDDDALADIAATGGKRASKAKDREAQLH